MQRSNVVPYAIVWEYAWIVDLSETIAVYDVKIGVYCKLNIHMCLRPRSFFDLSPRSLVLKNNYLIINIFKHILLRNQWAAIQSRISCRSFLGCRKKYLFKWSWTRGKNLKTLLWSQLSDVVETSLGIQHRALMYYMYQICSNDDIRLTFDFLTQRSKLCFLMHLYGKPLKWRITQRL